MAENERVRVEVGFASGGTLVALVPPQQAEELAARFRERGDAVVELAAEDGAYQVAIPHVTYVKRFARESRLGFGHG